MATSGQIIHAKAIEIGKLAVRATTEAGSGHPTTALSLAHLVTALMYRTMRWDPANPGAAGSDRLVLSEGHAVPIIYAACADLGVAFGRPGATRSMTVDDLWTLRDIKSLLDGHPNPALGFPFFDAATGSLGQGLSIAAGLGCAARLDGLDKRIYCIIGDGELREGQIWEAMDFIRDQGLRNVVAIFNCNTLGQSDFVSEAQDWEHLCAKAKAFGWVTFPIDGHDPDAIEEALAWRPSTDSGERPLAIVARTVKGWGVPQLHGAGHHGVAVKKEDLTSVLAALDERASELGVAGISKEEMATELKITPPPPVQKLPKAATPVGFAEAVRTEESVAKAVNEKKVLSPRRAYGLALKSLGEADPRVVALDGDVKNSTYVEEFAKIFPERYFEGRIAEQNMVSAAAGLAAAGKIAFASTFGRFMERAFDQVEMAVIGGLHVKLVGTHVGVTLASDGPSQMGLADIAFMRALAHAKTPEGHGSMIVLTPSDAVSTYALTLAMANHPGACYLRAVRADLPLLYRAEENFSLDGHKIVRIVPKERIAVILVACGYMVHSCLKAAEVLERHGVTATVIDAYALPFDASGIFDLARATGAPILAVEDNYAGGLGSELAEAAVDLRHLPRIRRLMVRNIPKSGRKADDVLGYVHLSVEEIVQAATALARSRDAAE